MTNGKPVADKRSEFIFCAECGMKNAENNYKCVRCGTLLHEQSGAGSTDSGISSLIPYRNAQALWAYYLAIFSLIPCVGIPLGIAALMLGIRGLQFAGRNPEAKGHVHAWIGIVLGTICALVYTVLLIALFLIPK